MIIKNITFTLLFIAFFFNGSNLMALAFPEITKFILLISLLLLFRFVYINEIQLNFTLLSIRIKLILILILIFVFISNLATLYNVSIQTNVYFLIKFNLLFAVMTIILFYISYTDMIRILRLYNLLIVYTAIVGIVGLILINYNVLHIFAQYYIPPRTYNFYGLLFLIEKDSILSINNISLYRLQSLFDEPGSYAFLLLPSIIWYRYHEKRPFILIILYSALLFTFSIGAIISLLLFHLIVISRSKIKILKYFIVISFLILILYLSVPTEYYNAFISFIEYKFGIGSFANMHTSGGERLNQLNNFISLIKLNVFGLGLSGNSFALTSGILREMIASGIIGIISLIVIYIIFFLMVLDYIKIHNYFLASIGFSIMMEGFQRASMFQSFLTFLMFVIFIKMYIYKKDKIYE